MTTYPLSQYPYISTFFQIIEVWEIYSYFCLHLNGSKAARWVLLQEGIMFRFVNLECILQEVLHVCLSKTE